MKATQIQRFRNRKQQNTMGIRDFIRKNEVAFHYILCDPLIPLNKMLYNKYFQIPFDEWSILDQARFWAQNEKGMKESLLMYTNKINGYPVPLPSGPDNTEPIQKINPRG